MLAYVYACVCCLYLYQQQSAICVALCGYMCTRALYVCISVCVFACTFMCVSLCMCICVHLTVYLLCDAHPYAFLLVLVYICVRLSVHVLVPMSLRYVCMYYTCTPALFVGAFACLCLYASVRILTLLAFKSVVIS